MLRLTCVFGALEVLIAQFSSSVEFFGGTVIALYTCSIRKSEKGI